MTCIYIFQGKVPFCDGIGDDIEITEPSDSRISIGADRDWYIKINATQKEIYQNINDVIVSSTSNYYLAKSSFLLQHWIILCIAE